MPTFVYPRTHRVEEFLAGADLNTFVGDAVRSLGSRPAARILHADTEGRELGSGSFQAVNFDTAVFDTGLWDQGSGFVVPDEGLYLFGMNLAVEANAAGVRLAAIRLNDAYQLARAGPFLGHGSRLRMQTWGTWYAYPGDAITAQAYQSSGDTLNLLTEAEYGTHLWGIQLVAGRTVETWTSPVTWASGDTPSPTQLNQQIRDNLRFLRSRPACRVLETASGQSINNATTTALTFDCPIIDNTSTKQYSTATTTRITIRRTGIYLVGGSMHMAANVTGQVEARVRLNGSTVLSEYRGVPGNSGHGQRPNLIGLASLTSGDYIELTVFQNSGGALDHLVHREHAPVLWAVHVSDTAASGTLTNPKSWLRLEGLTAADLNTYLRDNLGYLFGPPAVRMTRTTNQAIPTSTISNTFITFNGAESFDNDGMGGGGTTITFNDAGLYLIGTHIPWAANATGSHRQVKIIKNTSTIIGYLFCFQGLSGEDITEPCVTLARMAAGDSAEVAVTQNSGANLDVVGATRICDFWAVRVGA